MKNFSLFATVAAKNILAGSVFFISSTVYAQWPSKCLEIESILVDACVPGTGCTSAASPTCNCEGKNEMVRFKTGAASIPFASLYVDWPNNSWLGIHSPDATTAAVVSALNSTVLTSCGVLLEPTGGMIPAHATVLLVGSTDMCTTANSFASLNDTIYVIFQNAGNYQGHFANNNNSGTATSSPTGASSLRTLIMGVSTASCYDTATYDRSLLVNTSGTYGGSSALNDGARADFSWPGAPVVTYLNLGCMAPFTPTSVTIMTSSGSACVNDTLFLTAAVNGEYSGFSWSGGTGTFTAPGSTSTQYIPAPGDAGSLDLYASAFDPCGDEVRDTVTITVTPLATVSINASGPLTFCAGGSVDLQAITSLPVSWSPGGSSAATITANSSGTYIATVSNSCNTDRDTAIVTVNPLPVINIPTVSPVCETAGAFTVSATPAGGTWSGTYISSAGVVDPAGHGGLVFAPWYTVTDANGCTDSLSTTINIDANPAISITPVADVCEGSAPFNLSASPTGGTWSGTGITNPSAGTFDPAVAGTGTHTITYTATNGTCTNSSSIDIHITAGPVVHIDPAGPVCEDAPAFSLTASPAGGTWSGPGTSASGLFSPSSVGNGTFTIVYNATSSGCPGSDTLQLQVDELLTGTINPPGTLCSTASPLNLTATPAGGTWLGTGITNASAGTFDPALAGIGTHAITYTITNGTCTTTITTNITIAAGTSIAVTALGPTDFCQGGSVQLMVSGAGASPVTWSNGQTGDTITVSTGGNYYAMVNGGCGNDTSNVITVTVHDISASFSMDPASGKAPLEVNLINTTTDAVTWVWLVNDTIYAVNTNTSVTYDSTGYYPVTLYVISGDGCVDSLTQTVYVYGEFSIVVPNVFTPNDDHLNDHFSVQLMGVSNLSVHIFNRWGQEIHLFESDAVTDGATVVWDGKGKNGDLASDGTYAFLLTAKPISGDPQVYKGFVTLISRK